jgi:hypothetical protein
MRTVDISKLGEETWANAWPEPYHPDIRFIVLRKVGEDEQNETCMVIGFLKKGSKLLVDESGNHTGGTPRPGDFIDDHENFVRLGYSLHGRRVSGSSFTLACDKCGTVLPDEHVDKESAEITAMVAGWTMQGIMHYCPAHSPNVQPLGRGNPSPPPTAS